MVNRILGIVGWLGTALVFGAVVARFVKPEWDHYAIYAAWAGLACVVLYTLGQWREVVTYFQRRQARYGALAGTSVLIVLGLLVAVNWLSTREHKRWDLTANRQFSLSAQTVKMLKDLDAPVKLLVFDQGNNLDRYKARLTEYEYNSNKKVATEYIDADKKPAQAKQYNVEAYGTIVAEYKGRQERVTSDTEQDLTNALIKVVTGEKKKVYFVEGHGEKDQTGTGRDSYSAINTALGRDNYAVEKLVLVQIQNVPDDASVLVLAGPKNDPLQPEIDMLRRYLNRGGHLLVLLDAPAAADAHMPGLEGLLKEWGIDPGQDVVVDASGMGRLFGADDASMPVAASYPQHPITDRFKMLTAFPLARSVTPIPGIEGRPAMPLIQTSPQSWAEADIKGLLTTHEVSMDAAKGDKPGPVTIGVSVAAAAPDSPKPPAEPKKPGEVPKTPESRLVAIGDSDFAANAYLGISGNRDLFMNTVNWLAQQESLISIRPTEASDRRITLTARQQTGIFWLVLLVIPAAVLGTGVMTWSRRR